ncbi:putative trehalose-phosphatase [Helianthus anomalus]
MVVQSFLHSQFTPLYIFIFVTFTVRSQSTNTINVNTLLESMRSSSPTSCRREVSHYSLKPPALEASDAIKNKQIIVFLDYDGTLSPIVDDPDRAYMSDTVIFVFKSWLIHKSLSETRRAGQLVNLNEPGLEKGTTGTDSTSTRSKPIPEPAKTLPNWF